jgi:hypothetical protein
LRVSTPDRILFIIGNYSPSALRSAQLPVCPRLPANVDG